MSDDRSKQIDPHIYGEIRAEAARIADDAANKRISSIDQKITAVTQNVSSMAGMVQAQTRSIDQLSSKMDEISSRREVDAAWKQRTEDTLHDHDRRISSNELYRVNFEQFGDDLKDMKLEQTAHTVEVVREQKRIAEQLAEFKLAESAARTELEATRVRREHRRWQIIVLLISSTLGIFVWMIETMIPHLQYVPKP